GRAAGTGRGRRRRRQTPTRPRGRATAASACPWRASPMSAVAPPPEALLGQLLRLCALTDDTCLVFRAVAQEFADGPVAVSAVNPLAHAKAALDSAEAAVGALARRLRATAPGSGTSLPA